MARLESAPLRSPPFGRLLKEWRQTRAMSQLDLGLSCGVSQRHVSFIESGRSRPSRGMVLNLANALAVPLRQQNALLLAAGFAPAYGERPLDSPEMRAVNEALVRTLRQQEPYPAVAVDRVYNLVRGNEATFRLLGFLLGDAAGRLLTAHGRPPNLAELLLAPDGLRPMIENWQDVAVWLMRRLHAEAALGVRGEFDALLERLRALPDVAGLVTAPSDDVEHPPVLVTQMRRDGARLALFSLIATMGTPLDVALQDLRLEFFFPADTETERWFHQRAN